MCVTTKKRISGTTKRDYHPYTLIGHKISKTAMMMLVGMVLATSIVTMNGKLSSAAAATIDNAATSDKNFKACYETVMATEALINPAVVGKTIPAGGIKPLYKIEVIQNMTGPVRLKPTFPGANMTLEEATMSQIAQCMRRLQR